MGVLLQVKLAVIYKEKHRSHQRNGYNPVSLKLNHSIIITYLLNATG